MPLSEFELKKIEKAGEAFLKKRRPPVSARHQVDLGWRIDKKSVLIIETRPVWNNPSEHQELICAKATFVRSQGIWKIYWMRQDLKWHSYEPCSHVKAIGQVFDVVDKDEYGCFFG
jgi:hypothetical protein